MHIHQRTGIVSFIKKLSKLTYLLGGDETRSGYVRYIQGYQPNVPARTMCRHGLYNSMVRARTILEALKGYKSSNLYPTYLKGY